MGAKSSAIRPPSCSGSARGPSRCTCRGAHGGVMVDRMQAAETDDSTGRSQGVSTDAPHHDLLSWRAYMLPGGRLRRDAAI